jgi:hypothetical protein
MQHNGVWQHICLSFWVTGNESVAERDYRYGTGFHAEWRPGTEGWGLEFMAHFCIADFAESLRRVHRKSLIFSHSFSFYTSKAMA